MTTTPNPPRVRFAPSPTGDPHLGSIRTALFNYLFAKHGGGEFIMRIEDTDQNRLVPGAQKALMDGLRWLGLQWDEGPEVDGPLGPYVQSERTHQGIYDEHAKLLLANGWAYECYCPSTRLDEVRAQQQAAKQPPMYDRHCSDDAAREAMRQAHPGAKPVVRFRVPLDEPETMVVDALRGNVTVANSTLDDFVLLKSDGFPTYHLANVVDDHLMQITHVIRAEEWLPSLPRHVLIYRGFGWQHDMPVFVHLPLILGTDRSKLSKRHGATSVLEYRRQGYLPEAMVNFLALLGWSLDDKTEQFTLEELVRQFSVEGISKSPAVFNKEKLDWMNGLYIRQLSARELAERLLPFLEAPAAEGGLSDTVARPLDHGYLAAIIPLVHERLKLLSEGPELVDLFYVDTPADRAALAGKALTPEAAHAALAAAVAALEAHGDWGHEALEALLRPMAEVLGLKTGVFFGLLRVAVTGRTVSPPLFETMAVLGRNRTLGRMLQALGTL